MQPSVIRVIEEEAVEIIGLIVKRRIEIVENLIRLIPTRFDSPDGVSPIAMIDEQNTVSQPCSLRYPLDDEFNAVAASDSVGRLLRASTERASAWRDNAGETRAVEKDAGECALPVCTMLPILEAIPVS